MPQYSPLELFLERIMGINILRMGGASAGIFGSTGADNDVLHSLKKSSIAFAAEYKKPTADQVKLEQLSNEIHGYIQTLQLLTTLSEKEAHKLIDQLQELTK